MSRPHTPPGHITVGPYLLRELGLDEFADLQPLLSAAQASPGAALRITAHVLGLCWAAEPHLVLDGTPEERGAQVLRVLGDALPPGHLGALIGTVQRHHVGLLSEFAEAARNADFFGPPPDSAGGSTSTSGSGSSATPGDSSTSTPGDGRTSAPTGSSAPATVPAG